MLQTPLNITATLDLLPVKAKKQTLKNLVGILNQSIIAYARAHLRAQRFPQVDNDGNEHIPTIDDYNEWRAREQERIDNDDAVQKMGFVVSEKPIIQMMRFVALRTWFELEIAHAGENVAFDPVWDAPFDLENSLDFAISRAPRHDEAEIKKFMAATGRTFQQLQALTMQQQNDDRADLIKSRGEILALYEECATVANATIRYTYNSGEKDDDDQPIKKLAVLEPYTDAADIECLIASLPLQSQYRLAVRVHNLLTSAADNAIKTMMAPAGLFSTKAKDAAADLKLIDAARAQHYQQLVAFVERFETPLMALVEERNVYLPPLPEPVEDPTVAAMDATARQEDAILFDKETLRDAASREQPLRERLARRAPAPDGATTAMAAALLAKLDAKKPDDGVL